MHKKLAGELTSLAHRILQMKNKEDVILLKQKAYEVYEKLTVLAYVEEYLNTTPQAKETKEELLEKISNAESLRQLAMTEAPEHTPSIPASPAPTETVSEQVSETADETSTQSTPTTVSEPEVATETSATSSVNNQEKVVEEVVKEEVLETPIEAVQTAVEEVELATSPHAPEPENKIVENTSIEEATSKQQDLVKDTPSATATTATEEASKHEDIQFERITEAPKQAVEVPVTPPVVEEITEQPFDELEQLLSGEPTEEKNDVKDVGERKTPTLEEELQDTLPVDVMANLFEKVPPKKSLNDHLQSTIQIGLNDRIAFVKHLFEGSQNDFNRVISQLNTIKTEKEAKRFLNKLVKPDYDWTDKEEYEARLIEIIERRFA